MGEGDLPRPRLVTLSAGDPAACEEKDERRDPGLADDDGGGGFIALATGVDGTELVLGVGGTWLELAPGCSGISDAVVTTEPASEAVEPRLTAEGRDVADGKEGVRECLISIRLARDIGCTSGTPLRKTKVLTWTALMRSA